MTKRTKILLAIAGAVSIAAAIVILAPHDRGVDTSEWVTYRDSKFDFTFRHPAGLLPTANLGNYAKDPEREYYTINFYKDAPDASTDFFMEIRILEEDADISAAYADREAVMIGGREYRYINAVRDPATPSYWMEYITRLDPKWKFEFYSDYGDENHAAIIEAIAESIRIP